MRLTGSFAECLRLGDVDAIVVDNEIGRFLQRAPATAGLEFRHHAVERRRALGLRVFECGAKDGGEVADILGDQEIMLHEALDVF